MLWGSIYSSVNIFTTILNRSDTRSNGLKSQVPAFLVKLFGLKKGSKLKWNLATIVEGKIVETGEDNGGKLKKSKEPEIIIIVRKNTDKDTIEDKK